MLLLLACVGDTGFVADSPAPEALPAADAVALDFGEFAPRNLVVVHVDTLRADALQRWGGVRATTPHLDARPGWISISDPISTASWTLPATASLLTATDLPRHGLRAFDPGVTDHRLRGTSTAQALREVGFDTALFSGAGMLLDPTLGLGTGFALATFVPDQPDNAGASVEAATAWLDTLTDRPFFLFLQPTDPHAPLQPADGDLGVWSDAEHLPFDPMESPEAQEQHIRAALDNAGDVAAKAEILEQVHAVYDEQILGLDRALEALFLALEERDLLDDTLIVLSADHGESFLEGWPSVLGHGGVTRRELLRVPLMFWGAGLTDQHAICLASSMDTLPTALDLLRVPALPDAEGRSLRQGCRDVAFSSVYESADAVERLTWVSATNLDAQVVTDCTTGEVAAFDLPEDPGALDARAPSDVPGADTLATALEGYAAEVAELLPVTCAGGR